MRASPTFTSCFTLGTCFLNCKLVKVISALLVCDRVVVEIKRDDLRESPL